ncbi:MAG: N-acetylneuraminate synthase family protein [Anaerolineales bacterium]|nr:N-acetylneuraminate synthase family protein [Anaerolineales bacterium]
MKREVKIGNTLVGDGHPTFIVAEVGINHNGDLEIAKQLIDVAKWAGVDAVKFQKRTPELCVPEEQKSKMRETPWGYISYLDYRTKVEFGIDDYQEIDRYCKEKGLIWFASPWDEKSVDFLEDFSPVCYKVASASLTDRILLEAIKETGRPVILSTGMSTVDEIQKAVDFLGTDNLIITHTTSAYPCEPDELNLKMIRTLQEMFPTVPVGYSGHEVGLVPSAVAVAMGACMVERHITLDRALWGSDQAASVEPGGLNKLVKYIRTTEAALGTGEKVIYESEIPSLSKLRRSNWRSPRGK